MQRIALPGLVLGILFSAEVAFAALPAYYTNDTSGGSCTVAQPCSATGKIVTFYIPIVSSNCRNTIQGCVETSRIGLDGRNDPITLDAVREGKAKYATCASDPSNYGKYFNMGTITYRSALGDKQMYTVPNVICYVHDTGGAFRGRPDKLDLATTICVGCTDSDAMRIASGSKVNVAGVGPVDIGYPTGIGAGQILDHDYYCIRSIEPVIVWPVPAGTPFPSGCYNSVGGGSLVQRPLPPPQSFAMNQNQLPVTQQSSQPQPINQGTSTPPFIPPQSLLIAQPTRVKLGNPVLVSWASVGMSAQTPCQISQNGQLLAQTNTGSKIVQTKSLQTGALSFTLSCTTQAGQPVQQSISITII